MKLCNDCGQVFDHSEWVCPSCSRRPAEIAGRLAFAPDLAAQSEGFEPEYFENLAKLEAHSFWFRSRNQLLIWALQKYFPDAQSFMEVGCGTGFVLSGIREALPRLSLCGSEVFSMGLSFAAERLPGAELFQMDARHIPFQQEFDVIGAFDVLEHIKEDEEVLAQMYQATRRGGGILITVPRHPFLWSRADEYARHVRRYTARELAAKVRRAGFDVVRITSFVSLLFPGLILSRFKESLSRSEFDPEGEFIANPFLNVFLERTLTAERALIRAGVSFPVGGSLLLVAHRNESSHS